MAELAAQGLAAAQQAKATIAEVVAANQATAEQTRAEMAKLVAQNRDTAQQLRSLKRPSSGCSGCLVVLIAAVGIVWLAGVFVSGPASRERRRVGDANLFDDVVKPILRKVQVPVDVSVRPSMMGWGPVFQIRNHSPSILMDVKVVLWNPEKQAETLSYVISSLKPDEVREVGAWEFDCILRSKRGIKIYCEGYLPLCVSIDAEPKQ